MDPAEECRRFWDLGYLTAAEAALLAIGGSATDDAKFHEDDLAEATSSGPYTTAELPALDRYRISIERFLTCQGIHPGKAFPVDLFSRWLATRPDCPGHQVALDAGVGFKPRRLRRATALKPPTPGAPPSPGSEPPRMDEPGPGRARLIPVARWADHYDWPTVAALRSYVFNAHRNGFDKVVHRVGRRVLIDEDAFQAWARHPGKKPAR